MVWNPYLAQTRWIELRNSRIETDQYVIGYDNSKNHKVLVLFDNHLKHEIYDFKSSSWRVLDIINLSNPKRRRKRCVSLKGNSYFVVDGKLLGFDFIREKFGPCMDLPFDSSDDFYFEDDRITYFKGAYMNWGYGLQLRLSQMQCRGEISLKLDMKTSVGLYHWFEVKSFFIEKEKKVAVVCGDYDYKDKRYVVGEDGCYQEKTNMKDIVFSYVPSLVQIQ